MFVTNIRTLTDNTTTKLHRGVIYIFVLRLKNKAQAR